MKKNRPIGLKYKIKKVNPTWIKKGQHLSLSTEIKKGQRISPITEFKKGDHKNIQTEFGNKPAWNKGRKGLQPNHNLEGLKIGWGMFKGIKRPEFTGELHPNWKGGIKRLRFLKKRRRSLEKKAEGTHTLKEWIQLKEKFSFTCIHCKKSEPTITLTEDHILPLSRGGNDFIDNIQPLCRSCNSIKHDRLEGEF